jgi:hypothetical protein
VIRAVAEEALRAADRLVPAWLPDGRAEGHEWSATNPRRADAHPGSFKINMRTGAWADFATEDKGGDLVSLAAYLRGCGQGEAAKALAAELGIDISKPAAAPPRRPAADKAALPGTALLPWPADHPALEPIQRPLHGAECQGCWVYRDAAGAGLLVVARYATEPRKTYMPWHLRSLDCGQQWRAKYPEAYADGGRPIYGLDRLAARREAPVLVTEGEKACEAAAALLPAYVVITSPGGSKAAAKADWSALAGRTVVIWPDLDDAGAAYARDVTRLALSAGASGVQMVEHDQLIERHGLPLELPAGWDAADWPAGQPCDLAGCLVAARAHRPETPAAPSPSPDAAAETEGAAGCRKHRRLITAIKDHLTNSGLQPDALDGWRHAEGWRLACVDNQVLAHELAYVLRHGGSWSLEYITQTLEHVVRLMRLRRRETLLATIIRRDSTVRGQQAASEYLRAVTGGVDPTDLAVFRHWVWTVKRQASGMHVDHHVMPVIVGGQGSGKTTAAGLLVKPLAELALNIDVSYMTDERRVRALAHLVVGRWEEMSGAARADLETLKRQITDPTISYRPMRSNSTVVLPRTCSFIGTSNIPVQDLVQDTTGARRFYELKTPARCDWSRLADIDPLDVWACVSETEPAPASAVLSAMREQQADLVHKDAVSLWLEGESWGAMQVRDPDGDLDHPQRIQLGYHNPAHGETFEEVSARFRHWCQVVGQPPLGSKVLAARLRQEGFTRGDQYEGGRHVRVWKRPAPIAGMIAAASPANVAQGVA